jgi:hypothetical protein
MIRGPHDPHLPFEEVARDLKREHRSRQSSRRAPRHSRPRTLSEVERKRRLSWTFAVIIGVGLAVAIGFLVPT